MTLVVVAGLVGQARPPAADGSPVRRDDGADWPDLRRRAGGRGRGRRLRARTRDYAVGAAGLVDDGRIVVGCNVENASYGLTLCAECGLVSALHATGGGRLVAVAVARPDGRDLAPCGRCRQLLWEHGGPELLVNERPMREWLPARLGLERAGPLGEAVATDILDVLRTKRDGGRLSTSRSGSSSTATRPARSPTSRRRRCAWRSSSGGWSPTSWPTWTQAMIDTGERLDLSAVGRPTVDKHSTGGVGDKISLPLVPLVAACGAAVPQLGGRGLGHTGGTLDKMEAIAGWRAMLSNAEAVEQLRSVGAIIAAAGSGLAPADRKLYALRDVTATVEAIPLIASSIMSKKIAEGTGALVLDVKVGSGAFMPEVERARQLAETMVELGEARGVRTVALLTDMSVPLGRAVGNAVEVDESIAVLGGGGPADVVEVTVALAREMLDLVGLDDADPAGVLAVGRGAADVGGDGRGAGRRPVGPAARGDRAPDRRRAGAAASSRSSTPAPSASPPGASAPAGPARRMLSRWGRGSCACAPTASRSRRASRSSNCGPTTLPGSPPPKPPSKAPGPSPTPNPNQER